MKFLTVLVAGCVMAAVVSCAELDPVAAEEKETPPGPPPGAGMPRMPGGMPGGDGKGKVGKRGLYGFAYGPGFGWGGYGYGWGGYGGFGYPAYGWGAPYGYGYGWGGYFY